MDKNKDQSQSFKALEIQLEIAQQIILAMCDKHGEEQTLALLEDLIPTLDPHHGALLNGLVTAMKAAAMGDAGGTVH